jgi:hypothetical protein
MVGASGILRLRLSCYTGSRVMDGHQEETAMENYPEQQDLFNTEAVRSLLDQLLTGLRLYTQSKDYKVTSC